MWTSERIERMKALWAEGKSASEVAAEIGTTRNAVIGKLDRLRIKRGHVARPKRERAKRPPRERRPRDLAERVARPVIARRAIPRPPKRHEPTKAELYAMLNEAVRNTARMAA